MSKKTVVRIPSRSTGAILAPPCCGKGTFCRKLNSFVPGLHISTGELFRSMNNPDFNGVMAGGGLIENDTTLHILKNHVSKSFDDDVHQMLWLDGFPRDEKQVGMLHEVAIGKVFLIHLKIHNSDVVRRFRQSLEKDEERSTRPDNSIHTFMRRLDEYRRKETKILKHAHALKIPVIKREISNTENAAETFYFKHMHPENPHQRTHQPHGARHK